MAALGQVERLLADPAKPVVFFALQWCEFCWSVRRLLRATTGTRIWQLRLARGPLRIRVRAG